MKNNLAWHFTADTLRDGQPLPRDSAWAAARAAARLDFNMLVFGAFEDWLPRGYK